MCCSTICGIELLVGSDLDLYLDPNPAKVYGSFGSGSATLLLSKHTGTFIEVQI